MVMGSLGPISLSLKAGLVRQRMSSGNVPKGLSGLLR